MCTRLCSVATCHELHLASVILVQTLMDQAAWNLCPVSGVSSGTACYYADDQTFTDLIGHVPVTIDDCPDGEDMLVALRLFLVTLTSSVWCVNVLLCSCKGLILGSLLATASTASACPLQ